MQKGNFFEEWLFFIVPYFFIICSQLNNFGLNASFVANRNKDEKKLNWNNLLGISYKT